MTEPTREDAWWANKARLLDRTALQDLQGVAEKWRNGLTGLAATAALVSTVSAPYVSGSLPQTAARTVGVLLVLAVGALALGSWKVMRAAFGSPETIDGSGEALQEWHKAESKLIISKLNAARGLTAGGLILLIAASSVAYFGTSDQSLAEIKGPGDQVMCGSLSYSSDGTTARVVAKDGTVLQIAVADLIEVKSRDSCD